MLSLLVVVEAVAIIAVTSSMAIAFVSTTKVGEYAMLRTVGVSTIEFVDAVRMIVNIAVAALGAVAAERQQTTRLLIQESSALLYRRSAPAPSGLYLHQD